MKKTSEKKVTNEKPESLDPVGFEEALRAWLIIPPSEQPKGEEKKQRKSTDKKKPSQ